MSTNTRDSKQKPKTAFEKKVDRCRKDETAELIDNAAWDHAIYLFKSLLEVAAEKKEKVRIISGSLNNEFYSTLSEELQRCIASGVEIEVLILDETVDIDTNDFARMVKNHAKGAVLKVPQGSPIGAPHMLVIGENGQRFRLEIDHSQTKAVASFNNADMGKSLLRIYENVKEQVQLLIENTNKKYSSPVSV